MKTIYIYSEIVTIRKAVKYTKAKSEKTQKKGGEKEKNLKMNFFFLNKRSKEENSTVPQMLM